MNHRSIQLAAAIINKGAGSRAASISHTHNREILLVIRGRDTASSTVMDCLEPDESEKDLVLGLSNKSDVDHLLHTLDQKMESYKPGHGIAFTLSLSGISLAVMDILSRHENQTAPNSHVAEHKGDISMTNSHSCKLIVSVVHTNLSAPVVEATREADCQGGTLIKTKKVGTDADKKLFDITLSQERATLLILTPAGLRLPILKTICEAVMKETGEHVVVISLPVDAVGGLAG